VAGGCWATPTSFSSLRCYNSTYLFTGKTCWHIRSTQGGFLQAAVAIGIGLGSFAAGYLSGGKIEYGYSSRLTGMTFSDSAGNTGLVVPRRVVAAGGTGFFGWIFIVRSSALIQQQPQEDKKGVVIGAANWLSFVG